MSLQVPMHTALCLCQLPEDTQIGQVEGVGVVKGAAEYHITGVQRHNWLLWDIQFQHSYKKEQALHEYK